MSSSDSASAHEAVQFFLVVIATAKWVCSVPGGWLLVQKGSVSSGQTFLWLGCLHALHSLSSSHVLSCLFLPAALVYHSRSLQCPPGVLDIIQVILTVLQKRRGCEESWDGLPSLQGELVMSLGLDQSDASSLDARQAERHWMSLKGLLEKCILVPCVAWVLGRGDSSVEVLQCKLAVTGIQQFPVTFLCWGPRGSESRCPGTQKPVNCGSVLVEVPCEWSPEAREGGGVRAICWAQTLVDPELLLTDSRRGGEGHWGLRGQIYMLSGAVTWDKSQVPVASSATWGMGPWFLNCLLWILCLWSRRFLGVLGPQGHTFAPSYTFIQKL